MGNVYQAEAIRYRSERRLENPECECHCDKNFIPRSKYYKSYDACQPSKEITFKTEYGERVGDNIYDQRISSANKSGLEIRARFDPDSEVGRHRSLNLNVCIARTDNYYYNPVANTIRGYEAYNPFRPSFHLQRGGLYPVSIRNHNPLSERSNCASYFFNNRPQTVPPIYNFPSEYNNRPSSSHAPLYAIKEFEDDQPEKDKCIEISSIPNNDENTPNYSEDSPNKWRYPIVEGVTGGEHDDSNEVPNEPYGVSRDDVEPPIHVVTHQGRDIDRHHGNYKPQLSSDGAHEGPVVAFGTPNAPEPFKPENFRQNRTPQKQSEKTHVQQGRGIVTGGFSPRSNFDGETPTKTQEFADPNSFTNPFLPDLIGVEPLATTSNYKSSSAPSTALTATQSQPNKNLKTQSTGDNSQWPGYNLHTNDPTPIDFSAHGNLPPSSQKRVAPQETGMGTEAGFSGDILRISNFKPKEDGLNNEHQQIQPSHGVLKFVDSSSPNEPNAFVQQVTPVPLPAIQGRGIQPLGNVTVRRNSASTIGYPPTPETDQGVHNPRKGRPSLQDTNQNRGIQPNQAFLKPDSNIHIPDFLNRNEDRGIQPSQESLLQPTTNDFNTPALQVSVEDRGIQPSRTRFHPELESGNTTMTHAPNTSDTTTATRKVNTDLNSSQTDYPKVPSAEGGPNKRLPGAYMGRGVNVNNIPLRKDQVPSETNVQLKKDQPSHLVLSGNGAEIIVEPPTTDKIVSAAPGGTSNDSTTTTPNDNPDFTFSSIFQPLSKISLAFSIPNFSDFAGVSLVTDDAPTDLKGGNIINLEPQSLESNDKGTQAQLSPDDVLLDNSKVKLPRSIVPRQPNITLDNGQISVPIKLPNDVSSALLHALDSATQLRMFKPKTFANHETPHSTAPFNTPNLNSQSITPTKGISVHKFTNTLPGMHEESTGPEKFPVADAKNMTTSNVETTFSETFLTPKTSATFNTEEIPSGDSPHHQLIPPTIARHPHVFKGNHDKATVSPAYNFDLSCLPGCSYPNVWWCDSWPTINAWIAIAGGVALVYLMYRIRPSSCPSCSVHASLSPPPARTCTSCSLKPISKLYKS